MPDMIDETETDEEIIETMTDDGAQADDQEGGEVEKSATEPAPEEIGFVDTTVESNARDARTRALEQENIALRSAYSEAIRVPPADPARVDRTDDIQINEDELTPAERLLLRQNQQLQAQIETVNRGFSDMTAEQQRHERAGLIAAANANFSRLLDENLSKVTVYANGRNKATMAIVKDDILGGYMASGGKIKVEDLPNLIIAQTKRYAHALEKNGGKTVTKIAQEAKDRAKVQPRPVATKQEGNVRPATGTRNQARKALSVPGISRGAPPMAKLSTGESEAERQSVRHEERRAALKGVYGTRRQEFEKRQQRG